MPTTSGASAALDGVAPRRATAMTQHSVPPSGMVMNVRRRVADLTRAVGAHGWLISGARPGAPVKTVSDPWDGDPATGRAIVTNRYAFGGATITSDDPPWSVDTAPLSWRRAAHGFDWLRDLAAAGGEEGAACARRLVASWLSAQLGGKPGADRLIWSAGVTGRRVRAWLTHWSFLCGDGGPLAGDLLDSLGRQIRHLSWIAGSEDEGAERLLGVLGLVHGCLLLPAFEKGLPKAIGLLERELSYSILPDGCHATRSPRLQFEVLRDLVALKEVFAELQREPPIGLITAIDRLAPIVRFFRHGDGRLALFNDTWEGDAEMIDAVLGRADARGRPPARSPHGGFERLVAGKLLALVDAGAAPGVPHDGHVHAAPLAMEVSYGTERLIVNCGATRTAEGDWAVAQRSTAAHSTLGVADTNANEIGADGRVGRRRANTVVERNEADGAVWVEMSHDGYAKPFGLIHHRRLYMSEEGADLRGEDRLEGPEGHTFTLRFHLHPKVQVSLLANHAAALLRTPSGVGWRLRAQGADMSLTDSIYLGSGRETKRTQQLLLTGVTGPDGATVKWAMQRETKR
jgi:uncharacterized heparinase superfamily protein